MNNSTKRIWSTVIIVIAVLVAAHAIYRFCLRKSVPDTVDASAVAVVISQNDCMACHSLESKKPFYSSFPILKKQMAQHIRTAIRYFDMSPVMADLENIDEVSLAKLENTVLTGSMPIADYKMIHWGTSFNDKEKALLLSWITDVRAAKYPNTDAAAEFANEPIRPVPTSLPTDPAKVALGKAMYNDTRISLDNTISCASCHILADGGADEHGERTSGGINGQFGGVNAPTVYNAFFNIQQFWNGRAADLKEQAAGPPVNPVEMGDQTWDQIVERLCKDKSLVKEFKTVYPEEGLTAETVCDAIAEYEKTLLTPDCRFDLYLKGDASAITDEEKEGYRLFKENNCISCHNGVILGGCSFEYLGITDENYFADRDASIAYNSDDDGLKGFTNVEADLHKFKVPGLRNVALTSPYLHDGSAVTIEDAIKAMMQYETGMTYDDATAGKIVLFLNTLTGKNENLK